MFRDMRLFLFLCFFASGCLWPFLCAQADPDLSLQASDIRFSDELIAGTTVRLYATIRNAGDVDVTGYVSFFQGSVPIGDAQVISVLHDGAPEEVFVDFVVPSGSFNIRAEIRDTNPEDTKAENNFVLTKTFEPLFDDDGDGILNEDDNCSSVSNANQNDADEDGQGDVCDEDRDGDGVKNEQDAFPDDADRFEEEEVEEEQEAEVPSPVSDSSQTLVQEMVERLEASVEKAEEEIAQVEPSLFWTPAESLITSPQALFTLEKISWNTYRFEALTPEEIGLILTWDFGDGVTSQKREVEHVFARFGSYEITLTATDAQENRTADKISLEIPFWTLENRWVQGMIVGLFLMGTGGVWILRSKEGRKGKGKQKKISVREDHHV
jgi:hypothetical protein